MQVVETSRSDSVVELAVDPVPGVVWLPTGVSAPPVVLLGHGGSGHKRTDRNVRLGTWLAEQAGIASIAIDGPFHGDRAVPGDGPLDYQQRIAAEGAATVHLRMRDEWLATLDALKSAGLVDSQRVGYWGLSMGCRYGLPVCAALGPRLRCAVLGKFGLTSTMPAGLAADNLIKTAAAHISAPVLFHLQWDDELFPRPGQLDLFDLLPSADKQLRARPGGHSTTRPDDESAWRSFLTSHLVGEKCTIR